MMWNVIYDSENKKSEVFERGQSLVTPHFYNPQDLNHQDKSTD